MNLCPDLHDIIIEFIFTHGVNECLLGRPSWYYDIKNVSLTCRAFNNIIKYKALKMFNRLGYDVPYSLMALDKVAGVYFLSSACNLDDGAEVSFYKTSKSTDRHLYTTMRMIEECRYMGLVNFHMRPTIGLTHVRQLTGLQLTNADLDRLPDLPSLEYLQINGDVEFKDGFFDKFPNLHVLGLQCGTSALNNIRLPEGLEYMHLNPKNEFCVDDWEPIAVECENKIPSLKIILNDIRDANSIPFRSLTSATKLFDRIFIAEVEDTFRSLCLADYAMVMQLVLVDV